VEKMKEIAPYLDRLIINNYGVKMELHDNIKELYNYVKTHPKEFETLDIAIQLRYQEAILTNRAGSAPNRIHTGKIIKETCVMPFTDMFVFPNGKLGTCCCDTLEVTDLADLNEVTIQEAWNSPKYRQFREAMQKGRQNYTFCKYCDFMDAGLRMDIVNNTLKK
jgi:radical SAM protein with 4Fe4S-binding SPASM domain